MYDSAFYHFSIANSIFAKLDEPYQIADVAIKTWEICIPNRVITRLQKNIINKPLQLMIK